MPTKTLWISTADCQAGAFAAFPDRGERHPGVPLYTDAFGVRAELEERARGLAEHGYVAVRRPVPLGRLPGPSVPLLLTRAVALCRLSHGVGEGHASDASTMPGVSAGLYGRFAGRG